MTIYLDNAATSFPKPEQVYLAVDHAMREIGVGPGRGGYSRGIDASRLVFQTREAVAALLGVADSSRIVFTHSATEALNLALLGFLRPGDHVVTTTMEHNSLARPLRLAEGRGVEVTWVAADTDGYVTAAAMGTALRPNTRLVAMTHCSNVTGAIQPVEEVGLLTRRAGIALLVDAAQSAGSVPIDVKAMGIDLLAAPGHKGLFGPPGTGILYVGEGVELQPLMVGGTGGLSAGLEQPAALPERFESGTLNTPGIAGLKAGAEFILETGLTAIAGKERQLTAQLLTGLQAIPGVLVHNGGSSERLRGAVASFSILGGDPATIGFRLDREYGISVRVGLHCAPLAHQTIGTYPSGTVRVSPGYFNTAEEIDTLLRALRTISAG